MKVKLKASAVCPDNVLPEASVMVPLTITGISIILLLLPLQWQNKAAFALRVSKWSLPTTNLLLNQLMLLPVVL
jgi:hypothetical protein